MFDQFAGLPLHILVNHLAVVAVPVTALIALPYALVRSWRWALRWPLLGSAVVALVAVFVAKESGQALFSKLGDPKIADEHASRGQTLMWIVLAYAVVAVVAVFALAGPAGTLSGRDRIGARAWVQAVVIVLLALLALGALVQVVLTGDAGARAVWG